MTIQRLHHYIVEHLFRLFTAGLLCAATFIWLSQDGFVGSDIWILILVVLYSLAMQFHGLICVGIEKMFYWTVDFNKFD